MQNSTVTRRGFLRTASNIASTGALLRTVILLAVVVGFLAVCGRASAQIFAPSSSSAASADRSVWGQAIGVTSIILCKVPNCSAPEGTPEVILFSGLLEITKSSAVTLADKRRQIALKFDSLTSSGQLAARSAVTTQGFVKVWVSPDTAFKSVGILTEILPTEGHDDHQAAEGHAQLFLGFEGGLDYRGPSFGELRNIVPVELIGHIHSVPPITAPIALRRGMTPDELIELMDAVGGADKWVGANKEPVALVDVNGVTWAYFTANVHVTTLTGTCGDGQDNDLDGRIDEENGDNGDDDNDGFVDEDSTCPQ